MNGLGLTFVLYVFEFISLFFNNVTIFNLNKIELNW